ncbi:MAG: transglutaminase-like cysteine peptidase [Hyphomicrobiaceae bacterium]
MSQLKEVMFSWGRKPHSFVEWREMRHLVSSVVFAALACIGANAGAEPVRKIAAIPLSEPFMKVYGSTPPPFGFVSFCERQPDECVPSGLPDPDGRLEATPQRLSELDDINRRINHSIKPATDEELYGVREYWTMPVDAGDCEDYVLMKRAVLMRRGWPASALLITVVRDLQGDGHAVLTARTSQGDFVLDNKVDQVKLWSRTGYDYVMRQSFVDPRLWMALVPDEAQRSSVLTSNPASPAGR